jgi:multicomponent Na+:H+ antiporter subunit F
MPEALGTAALFVLVTVVVGLARVLRGPGIADRVMAVQLLGTGGIAVLLLLGAATGTSGLTDAALTLALLAAFATVALARGASGEDGDPPA